MSFSFMCPTILESGIGVLDQKLPEYLQMYQSKNILIVTDKGIESNGLLDGIIKLIEGVGASYVVFNGVLPDAPDYIIDQAVEVGKQNNVNTIISVGGGSSIDSAKAMNISISLGEDFRGYYGGIKSVNTPLLPHIAIPTTAGTGSEVSPGTVVSNTELNAKMAIFSYFLFPSVALVDANMMKSLPAHIAAATGLDALTHLMETCTTVIESTIADALAYEGVDLLVKNLPKVIKDGSDMEARQKVASAASMGALAFTSGSFHIPHAFAHAVGAKWHVPHGIACAWGLVCGIEHVADLVPEKVKRFAEIFGVKDVESKDQSTLAADLKAALLAFYEEVGISRLGAFDAVKADEIDLVADACMNEMNQFFKFTTRRVPDKAFFVAAIKAAL